jgi:DNA invertase Pin-like site-specific DNA recombinase
MMLTVMEPIMRYVIYLRCSTDEQGRDGYGLDAQQACCDRLTAGGEIVATYRETESGSNNQRPVLKRAIDDCRSHGARLVVAKLDRLARNVRYLLQVIDDDLGHIPLLGDMPSIENNAAGRLQLSIMASFAEFELGRIRERTREGMAAAKARGVWCGRKRAPAAARSLAQGLRGEGYGLRAIARELAVAGFRAPSGGLYEPGSIKRMLV